MKAVRVQYTVVESYVEQNKKNIEKVMADLRANPVAGLSYSSYYLGDGNFMHLNVSSTDEANKALSGLDSFTNFRTQLKASEPINPPKAEDLELVGSNVDLV